MNLNKKFFSKIGFNYLALAIIALIIQIILLNIIGIININLIYDINFNVILSAICNYIIPFPIFYYLMKRLDKTPIRKENINLKEIITYISITFTLMWIGNIIGLIITTLLGGAIQSDISNPVQDLINSSDILLNLILISIIGPIFEELFFRKMLIDRSIKYGARVSIILSAVLFAFFHGNLNQFFYAFLMGGFFAYVYIKTGKIIYTIILHIIVNFMGSVVSLFVSESALRLTTESITAGDLTIVLAYLTFLGLAFLIGILGLTKLNKSKFNGSKTEIGLKHPLTTMIINPGMICFIAFFIFEMIYQTIF